MKSAILAVGTELLFGQTVNTNAAYLSQKLNELGIDVMYHHTVGDNPQRLIDGLDLLFKDCDLIITTGGLGPTQDDLTKEIACEYMGFELMLHKPSLEKMEVMFSKMGRAMTENNKKQAFMPNEGIVLNNDGGTAPGCVIEKNGKMIACLPGPPREMKSMFDKELRPILEKKTANVIYSKMLRFFGLGESALEDEIKDMVSAQTDPTLATYAKEGEVMLRVTSKRITLREAEQAVSETVNRISKRIGQYIYSYDNEDLVDVVGRKLIEKEITLSCAESCTGGMFASTLIDVPGISAIFDRGIVTYSNEAKKKELGVKAETLDKFGAVSEEVAIEMAEGLAKKTGSRLCISVTGVAGPDGGTKEKPVGLSYVAVIFDGKKVCKEYRMRAVSRNWNRNYTVLHMLNLINQTI